MKNTPHPSGFTREQINYMIQLLHKLNTMWTEGKATEDQKEMARSLKVILEDATGMQW